MVESTGYDKLARFMTDEQYQIFRQFKSSAHRDLLFLQAELMHLESEFSAICKEDRSVEGEKRLYDRNWYILSTSKDRNGEGKQWEKALQIRAKLREYYSSLWQYGEIFKIPQARKRDVALLREWISRPDLGGGIAFSGDDLNGNGRTAYDEIYSHDLIALHHRVGENDPFTRFLSGPVFHMFERYCRYFKSPVRSGLEKEAAENNLFHYSDSHLLRVIDTIATLMASMAPLVSILILYFVQNLGYRLAIVCVFTLAFSTSLSVITKARRIEIFACTAAFASVQVVFLGSTPNVCIIQSPPNNPP